MASDLISREELFDAMREEEWQSWHPLDEVDAVIAKAPSVDAVPVVRCKDCVFYQPYIQEMYKGKGDCEEHDAMVCDNDFCSYGAKMDGGKQDGE